MRDFMRAAAFAFITPLFAALSIAFWTAGSIAAAFPASLTCINFEMSFTKSLVAPLRRALKTRRRSAARCAFFAELVLAIARDTNLKILGQQVVWKPLPRHCMLSL